MCCCPLEGSKHMAMRGVDRKPTAEEAAEPPDKRPWTEYDMNGEKQMKPEYKACAPSLCCCLCGPTCCVLELQWCSACGPDADTTCDVLCRCQTNRMKLFICCGPQRDDVKCCECFKRGICSWLCCCGCCRRGELTAGAEVSFAEACECDCIENQCSSRYAGCQPPCTCCHCSCVKVPPCCIDDETGRACCICKEEIIYMDGDLKPMVMARDAVELIKAPSGQDVERA